MYGLAQFRAKQPSPTNDRSLKSLPFPQTRRQIPRDRTGKGRLNFLHSLREDCNGIKLGDELERIGYKGKVKAGDIRTEPRKGGREIIAL